MRGRLCMITGANSGIGRATALALARAGADLVLVCRDQARGERATADVRSASAGGSVELMLADLASQDSIRRLAGEFAAAHNRLHVLVNNAGVVCARRTPTPDGIETTFAVNHLAPFLLTNLMLNSLRAGAPSRVVTVASHAHKAASIAFDNLQGERRYSAIRAYNASKLANILFTYELARRLGGTGVTAACVHPGGVRTNLGRQSPIGVIVSTLAKPFMLSPEKGAVASVYAASAPELEGVTGKYFTRRGEASSSAASRDEEAARRLWQVSEELTGLAS